jgi:hypothetical protein
MASSARWNSASPISPTGGRNEIVVREKSFRALISMAKACLWKYSILQGFGGKAAKSL